MAARLSGWARALVVGLVLAVPLSGCTLIGGGIGAIVGAVAYPSERVEQFPRPPPNAAELAARIDVSMGDDLRIDLRDGRRIEGRYRGSLSATAANPETYLLVEENSQQWGEPSIRKHDQPPRRVPASEILRVSVDLPNHAWLVGALIGLPLDLLALSVATKLGD